MDPVLERDAELRALADALAAAEARRGGIAVVAGEAGIGKTTLVRHFLDRLDRPAQVLQGACDDLLTPRPFGPLRDVARQVGGPLADALDDGGREAVMETLLQVLDDPLRVTVLVVEDAHWADDATLDVLRFLARRVVDLRSLVVLTYRDDEVEPGHPLQVVLGAMVGQRAPRIQLHRLSQAAVAQLAGSSGVDPLVLSAATGGNPFYVTEVLAAPSVTVPATVVDAVLARVRLLSPAAQQACEQLAILPGSAATGLVDRLLDDAEAAVAEAESRGVLQVSPDRVAFRHELARRAVEASLPVMRRVALHRRALAVLLDDPDPDAARVVHHAVEAGDLDRVVAHGPRAARAAVAAGAHRQAFAHLERLLAHLDRFPEAEQADLLEAHAGELYVLGHGPEPLVSQERALALRRRLDDPLALGRSLIRASRMHWVAADGRGAEACAVEAERVLEAAGPPSSELAMAVSTRAQLAMLADDEATALLHGRRAMDLARAVGDDHVLVHATVNVGTALAWGRDDQQGDDGRAIMREALDLAIAVGDDEEACRAWTNLAWSLADVHHFDEARAAIREGVAFAERQEQVGFAHYLRAIEARIHLQEGRLDEAERTCREILARAEPTGRVWLLPLRIVLARVLARRGDDEARTWIAQAREHASTADELQRIGPVAAVEAELAWLAGEGPPDGLADAHELAVRRGFAPFVLELGYWRWRLGDPVELEGEHPWALQVAGAPVEAAAAWSRLGLPYERALALLESDQPDLLVESVQLLDALGAGPAATIVRRRLRELGVRSIPRGPTAATRSHVAGLTPRQVEVLDLVAEGLTNAEIADRLVLSVRTVDHHVSAILQKLGVGARDEAVAAAAAREAAPHPSTVPPANGSR